MSAPESPKAHQDGCLPISRMANIGLLRLLLHRKRERAFAIKRPHRQTAGGPKRSLIRICVEVWREIFSASAAPPGSLARLETVETILAQVCQSERK